MVECPHFACNKKINNLILVVLFQIVILSPSCFPDEVILNSGRAINGLIVEDGAEYCLVKSTIGTIKLNKSDIKEIKRVSQEENYVSFGKQFLKSSNFEAASEQFKKALEINPECQPAKAAIESIPSLKQEYEKERALFAEGGAVSKPGTLVDIKINKMMELDFKTKKEVYDIRKKYVLEHPELVKGDYQPSDAVFGAIEDKKPWWGILGLSYYGTGMKSIEGESEETRFIVNPFILVALSEDVAWMIDNPKIRPKAIYPRPYKLVWKTDWTYARVTYNISGYWREYREHYKDAKLPIVDGEKDFFLGTYNARDLGFNFLFIDKAESRNIKFSANSVPVSIVQMIHCGGSCGYPGGCNNASPDQPELNVRIEKIPAKIYIKLWRVQPKDSKQAADMVFVIEAS